MKSMLLTGLLAIGLLTVCSGGLSADYRIYPSNFNPYRSVYNYSYPYTGYYNAYPYRSIAPGTLPGSGLYNSMPYGSRTTRQGDPARLRYRYETYPERAERETRPNANDFSSFGR